MEPFEFEQRKAEREMLRELKAYVPDLAALEHRLADWGAVLEAEIAVTDVYFRQPPGQVLKLVDDSTGRYCTRLQAREGGFEIVEHRAIAQFPQLYEQLLQAYGLHRILKKQRRLYRLPTYQVDLNLIETLGNFVILLGNEPTEAEMERLLQPDIPQYVRVPFCDLSGDSLENF